MGGSFVLHTGESQRASKPKKRSSAAKLTWPFPVHQEQFRSGQTAGEREGFEAGRVLVCCISSAKPELDTSPVVSSAL